MCHISQFPTVNWELDLFLRRAKAPVGGVSSSSVPGEQKADISADPHREDLCRQRRVCAMASPQLRGGGCLVCVPSSVLTKVNEEVQMSRTEARQIRFPPFPLLFF